MSTRQKPRAVSATVAREVLWHFGYYGWGTKPSDTTALAMVELERAAEPEYSELAALKPQHAHALREGRKSYGLEWLRSVVEADARLDAVAAVGEARAEERQPIFDLNEYAHRREVRASVEPVKSVFVEHSRVTS